MESTRQLGWICNEFGECIYLSSAWGELTGIADGVGTVWLNAVHPDDRRATWSAFAKANLDQEEYRIDYRVRRADGGYVLATGHGVPHQNAGGLYEGMFGITMTVHQQAEASKLSVETDSKRNVLTEREREVLRLFAEGYTAETAAVQLGITEETVKVHSKHAVTKLGALNRLHAVVTAIRLNELHVQPDRSARLNGDKVCPTHLATRIRPRLA
ncbi:hypothetical protein ASG47_20030 [Devosia sp. Leaf420]|nr:hypothetical protein ASG47_20030 [Devosia sp. Leaf420]